MKDSEKGFTIVELLVTFFIIAIISGMAFVNFRNANENLALQRAAHKVAQDIRRSADLAIQAEQANPCGGSAVVSGYGMFVEENKTEYKIYVNCNGMSNPGFNPGTDVFVETILLDEAVKIQTVSGGGTSWSVSFFPPDPTTFLCKNGHDVCPVGQKLSTASMTLALKSDLTRTKVIQVNKGGFADVN